MQCQLWVNVATQLHGLSTLGSGLHVETVAACACSVTLVESVVDANACLLGHGLTDNVLADQLSDVL